MVSLNEYHKMVNLRTFQQAIKISKGTVIQYAKDIQI